MDLFARLVSSAVRTAKFQFARRNGDAGTPDHVAADLFLVNRFDGFVASLPADGQRRASVLATADSCLSSGALRFGRTRYIDKGAVPNRKGRSAAARTMAWHAKCNLTCAADITARQVTGKISRVFLSPWTMP